MDLDTDKSLGSPTPFHRERELRLLQRLSNSVLRLPMQRQELRLRFKRLVFVWAFCMGWECLLAQAKALQNYSKSSLINKDP